MEFIATKAVEKTLKSLEEENKQRFKYTENAIREAAANGYDHCYVPTSNIGIVRGLEAAGYLVMEIRVKTQPDTDAVESLLRIGWTNMPVQKPEEKSNTEEK